MKTGLHFLKASSLEPEPELRGDAAQASNVVGVSKQTYESVFCETLKIFAYPPFRDAQDASINLLP